MVEEKKSEDYTSQEALGETTAESTDNFDLKIFADTINSELKKPMSVTQEIDAKIAEFKARMDSLTGAVAANLQFLKGGFKEPEEYKSRPKKLSAKQAARHLLGCRRVCVMTGAGISAGSGIPTFRG